MPKRRNRNTHYGNAIEIAKTKKAFKELSAQRVRGRAGGQRFYEQLYALMVQCALKRPSLEAAGISWAKQVSAYVASSPGGLAAYNAKKEARRKEKVLRIKGGPALKRVQEKTQQNPARVVGGIKVRAAECYKMRLDEYNKCKVERDGLVARCDILWSEMQMLEYILRGNADEASDPDKQFVEDNPHPADKLIRVV
jgi:hypothetical protein